MTSTEPYRLAMFPLGTVLFPGAALPLHVFEPRYRTMMDEVMATDRRFGVVLIARGSEVGGGDERVGVGTEADIAEAEQLPDGRWVLVATGLWRVAIDAWLPDDPYPIAMVRALPDGPPADEALAQRAAAANRRAWGLLSELGRVRAGEQTHDLAPWRLCDAAPLGALDRQWLLEIDEATERLEVLITLVDEVASDAHRLLAQGGSGP